MTGPWADPVRGVFPAAVTVAIIQHPPAVLDLAVSLERAAGHVADAAAQGAQLVVFPETWLTCYPSWVFGLAGWDDDVARSWYARLLTQSPVLDPQDGVDDLRPLREAASAAGVTVVMGLNERASRSSGTLYNSLVTIGPDGSTLNVHRKLTPTHTERIVWGAGDAAGLRVVDTPVGRVGGLVCWEHWHPLARQAMHAQHEQIHVAAWPDMPEMHQLAARTYAFEGRCFVLSAAQYLHTDDIPPELLPAYRAGVGPNTPEQGLLFPGGSGVIGPDGAWVKRPLTGEPGVVLATIDLGEREARSHDLDVVGHYARPDVFDLTITRRRTDSGVSWLA